METSVESQVLALKKREAQTGILACLLDLVCARNKEPTLSKPPVSLKTLYTDFEVRELSPFYNDGNPLSLEDLRSSTLCTTANAAPPNVSENEKEDDDKETNRKRPREDADDTPRTDLEDKIRAQVGPLVSAEDLQNLLNGLGDGVKQIPLVSVTDKMKRTELHKAIKTCLGATHISLTENGNVIVQKATAADRKEQRRRSNPVRQRKFLHFTLYKENIDSNQALRWVANHLQVSTRQLQFCGTKDKRAVTLQRVALQDAEPEKLAGFNEKEWSTQGKVKVCSFKEEDHGLRLGDALGNHFRIVLRLFSPKGQGAAAIPSPSSLHQITSAITTFGVINYFGPQRFGTTEILTSDVGVELLRSNYEAALRLVIASRAAISPELDAALPLLQERQFADALAATPYYCFQERDLLKHLVRYPNDFLGAFQTIPRTLAMLYFHAVQSLIWNRMVSRRFSDATRLKAEVGDLVLHTVYERRLSGLPDADLELDRSSLDAKALPATRVLCECDPIERFALTDVILPVPGPEKDLAFPQSVGCTRQDYDDVLTEMGLSLFDEDNHPLVKIFHYHGTYRAAIVRPSRFTLAASTVSGWRVPVVEADLEKIARQGSVVAPGEPPSSAPPTEDTVVALVVEFSLPPGSYATSVLREFCYTCGEKHHSGGTDESTGNAEN